MKEILKRIIRIFLPLLFITYLGGITLFTHSHVINGVVIVHSHPFKGKHQHNEAQLETIFFLSVFLSLVIPEFFFTALMFWIVLYALRIPLIEHIKCIQSRCGIYLRGPPPASLFY